MCDRIGQIAKISEIQKVVTRESTVFANDCFYSIAKMFIHDLYRFHMLMRFMIPYQITRNVTLTASCLRARALIDRANSID